MIHCSLYILNNYIIYSYTIFIYFHDITAYFFISGEQNKFIIDKYKNKTNIDPINAYFKNYYYSLNIYSLYYFNIGSSYLKFKNLNSQFVLNISIVESYILLYGVILIKFYNNYFVQSFI